MQGQLATEPGEALDVVVEGGGADPERRGHRREAQRVEAVAVGDLGGGLDDLVQGQSELASHQPAASDSARRHVLVEAQQ